MDDKLQPRQNGLTVLNGTSLRASSQTIAVQIHLTALNAKSEPESVLVAEFDRVFREESPECLEWAFQQWRDRSPYFPSISGVRALVAHWHRHRREEAQAEKRRVERESESQARREGKLVSFTDCLKQVQEHMKSIAEPEHIRKQREYVARMRTKGASILQAAAAALQLSPEEIQARLVRERAEIRQCEQDGEAG